MYKFVFFLVVFVFGLLCGQAQLLSSLEQKMDSLFQPWDRDYSPGAAVGVIQGGEWVFQKGYGMADLEHQIPITPSTVFYIGSVSKQFVTMCILLLEEEGKLALDDPIQTYLPDFPEYEKPLTIRNFIHHTSGVRDNLTLWSLTGRNYLDHIDEREIYELIKRQKSLNFTPGEQYLYSNSCYFMLGMIIEKASGLSLKEFGEKYIFEPLGMSHSRFHDDHRQLIPNRAFSYSPTSKEKEFHNLILRYDLVGSGGIYSSLVDLFYWDQNFYSNQLGKGRTELIDQMYEEGKLNNGERSGYAFALINGEYRGVKTVGHGGALAGYRAHYLRFPDQSFSVIILANVADFDPNQMALKVADVWLAEEFTPRVGEGLQAQGENIVEPLNQGEIAESLASMDLTKYTLEEYTGDFYSEELHTTYHITQQGDSLKLSIGFQPPMEFVMEAQDQFRANDVVFYYEREEGQIKGFKIDAGRVKNIYFSPVKDAY